MSPTRQSGFQQTQTRHWQTGFSLLGLTALLGLLPACSSPTPPAPRYVQSAPDTRPEGQRKPCDKPVYPEQARLEDRHGSVAFAFAIGTDGKVKNIQVLHSSGSADLDEAGRLALANCVFRPGIIDGKLVEAAAKVMYVF